MLIQWSDGQQTYQNAYYIFTSKDNQIGEWYEAGETVYKEIEREIHETTETEEDFNQDTIT